MIIKLCKWGLRIRPPTPIPAEANSTYSICSTVIVIPNISR